MTDLIIALTAFLCGLPACLLVLAVATRLLDGDSLAEVIGIGGQCDD